MAFRAYCDSKLMNVLFSAALANRLAGHGITVNSLHPGAIRSGFAVTERGFFGGLVRFGSFTLKSPEKGAETSIYLAGDPAVSEVTGQYFANCRRRTPSGAAQKIVAAERLWACSEGHIRIDPAL
jgi:NAD(P)-dependent dehydrogenase (short-subunit alcohol dehydrogenase family)